MEDHIIQQDELYALKSIFDEEFDILNKNVPEAKYFACVDLSENFRVIWRDLRQKDSEVQEMPIHYLPPLVLSFKLPIDYPSKSPPSFVLVCEWLRTDQIAQLCSKLDKLWEEESGSEILFVWASFLKEDSMTFLGITDTLDVSMLHTKFLNFKDSCENKLFVSKVHALSSESNLDVGSTSTEDERNYMVEIVDQGIGDGQGDPRAMSEGCKIPLIQRLTDYNKIKQKEAFQRKLFTCNICFLSLNGSQCTQFNPCGHVFCQNCVRDYFEVHIRDGRVQNILCPETECLSMATPSQIKKLTSAELFALYDRLLLNASLDTMTDVIYCPLSACQYPVIREPGEKMATCPVCRYAFCVYCKMVYHGIEPCRFKSSEKQKLVKEYQSGTSEQKLVLEQRYGKKQLQLLVDTTMSEEWIDSNSKNCPHCKASIEKYDGCNKITCWNCKTHFCWLCNAHLNQTDPYSHFTSPQSKCVNMLFHGLRIDEEAEQIEENNGGDNSDLSDTDD